MAEPFCLSDLQDGQPGFRRPLHGFATWGTWHAAGRRLLKLGIELAGALPRDLVRSVGGPRSDVLTVEDGGLFDPAARRIALYVHYAASGQISDMVRRQLDFISQAGFAVVFISMAPDIPAAQWQAVRQSVALAVRRANFGLDFGAWRDVMPEVARRWPSIDELMLANDSVLGPVHPLTPVIETMRSGGHGLFGLTESIQGGPHLQSYMLLARGTAAVRDVMDFLRHVHISHSKWLLIQCTELRLARWMRGRGHRVAAVFGYDRLVRAAVADQAERQRLIATQPNFSDLDALAISDAIQRLYRWPVNPTRHFWHLLVTRFRYPFIKTDLVLRGLSGLPEFDRWDQVVQEDSPCPLEELRGHLAGLKARRHQSAPT